MEKTVGCEPGTRVTRQEATAGGGVRGSGMRVLSVEMGTVHGNGEMPMTR